MLLTPPLPAGNQTTPGLRGATVIHIAILQSMSSNPDSGSVKGPLITGAASVLSALIGAGTAIFVASTTGHLTTPSDTREFLRVKQENMRLLQENEGLKEENAGLRQENTGLKQQNASLHDEIAQIRPEPSHDSKAQESLVTESTTRVDDFVSRLDGCQKSTSGVTCVVRVMNNKEDRVVRLYNNWTSIVDSTGNEQKAKVATLGASTNPYPWTYAETTLPVNVPVRATITFGRVDSNVNHLSILTLGIQCVGVTNGMPDKEQIQFRDITLH